ncbi:DUF1264 domain protein [Ilyonectria robusta]
MLIMPNRSVPSAAWDVAENWEMDQVVHLYGKVYRLWQTDKGHTLPLGQPQLMTSYTADGQFDFEKHLGDRDRRFGTDYLSHHRPLQRSSPDPDCNAGSGGSTRRIRILNPAKECPQIDVFKDLRFLLG